MIKASAYGLAQDLLGECIWICSGPQCRCCNIVVTTRPDTIITEGKDCYNIFAPHTGDVQVSDSTAPIGLTVLY